MTELPIIILRESKEINLFENLFSDWRFYFGLMLQGFFTGLGVSFANKKWENKISEILKGMIKSKEKKEKKHD